jgi:hypothetical protein
VTGKNIVNFSQALAITLIRIVTITITIHSIVIKECLSKLQFSYSMLKSILPTSTSTFFSEAQSVFPNCHANIWGQFLQHSTAAKAASRFTLNYWRTAQGLQCRSWAYYLVGCNGKVGGIFLVKLNSAVKGLPVSKKWLLAHLRFAPLVKSTKDGMTFSFAKVEARTLVQFSQILSENIA